jgi:cytosine/adenosine deaminase-related metal-dependent hydrolase
LIQRSATNKAADGRQLSCHRVTSDGVISAVGSASEVRTPNDARLIDCAGKTIVAGFWNSHVHFTQAVWRHAGTTPAAPMTAHMQEMLTK